MNNNFIDNSLELEPIYNKVDYELSKLEDNSDPLGIEDKHKEVNWEELIKDIEQLLLQQTNFRVIVWRMRAGFHIEGSSSLYKYLQLIEKTILEINDYDHLTDEEKDSISNFAAALSWLSKSQCISEFRDSYLTPEVKLTVRAILDLDIGHQEKNLFFADFITGEKKANEYFLQKDLPLFQEQIKLSIDSLEKISNFVNEYSIGYTLDCRNLIDVLRKLLYKLSLVDELKTENNKVDDDISKKDPLDAVDSTLSTSKFIGNKPVQTRAEVILALENILHYFEIYEPSHPAPILIRRVQKMIGMDFESIIQELLPDSRESLNVYVGNSNKQAQDNSFN